MSSKAKQIKERRGEQQKGQEKNGVCLWLQNMWPWIIRGYVLPCRLPEFPTIYSILVILNQLAGRQKKKGGGGARGGRKEGEKSEDGKKASAPSENRTRVSSVAGTYSTTRPMVLCRNECDIN